VLVAEKKLLVAGCWLDLATTGRLAATGSWKRYWRSRIQGAMCCVLSRFASETSNWLALGEEEQLGVSGRFAVAALLRRH
jgi:hypothetical protein